MTSLLVLYAKKSIWSSENSAVVLLLKLYFLLAISRLWMFMEIHIFIKKSGGIEFLEVNYLFDVWITVNIGSANFLTELVVNHKYCICFLLCTFTNLPSRTFAKL